MSPAQNSVSVIGLITALSLSLVACVGGPSASNGIQKGAEQKGGFMGLSKNDAVIVNTPAAFKNANTVVIGSFIVGFATYKTDSAKAGGGLMGNGMGGKSTAKSTLTGIDNATMQKITDKAYASFIASLKAKGYTIADRGQWTSYPDVAKIKATPSPHEDSSGGLFSVGSKTKYFSPSSLGAMRPFLGDIGQPSGFSALGANPTMAAAKFAKEKNVKVINAVYVLDFANADSYGGSWRSSSSVAVGQGVTVVPNASKIAIWGGDGGTFSTNNGLIALGQPITSEKSFASVSDSTTGADRASQTLANVIGVIGGVGTNAKRDYTFAARPSDYTFAANDALSQANLALTNKMANLK